MKKVKRSKVKDQKWLNKKAAIEDQHFISVGGLVSNIHDNVPALSPKAKK